MPISDVCFPQQKLILTHILYSSDNDNIVTKIFIVNH